MQKLILIVFVMVLLSAAAVTMVSTATAQAGMEAHSNLSGPMSASVVVAGKQSIGNDLIRSVGGSHGLCDGDSYYSAASY
jgi:hypothetical protein